MLLVGAAAAAVGRLNQGVSAGWVFSGLTTVPTTSGTLSSSHVRIAFSTTQLEQHVLPDNLLSAESKLPIQFASVVCVDESGTQGDEVLARGHVGRYAFDSHVYLLAPDVGPQVRT